MGKKGRKTPALLKFAQAARKGVNTLVDKVSAGASSSEDEGDEEYDETSRLVPSVPSPPAPRRSNNNPAPSLPTAQSIAIARQQRDNEQAARRPPLPPRSFLPATDPVPAALRPANYGGMGSSSSSGFTSPRRFDGYTAAEEGRAHDVLAELDDTRSAADGVIARLLGRGERLTDLADRTGRLENASSLFRKRGRRIESDRWFANHRNTLWLYCTGALVFVLLITTLVTMIVYIFTPKQAPVAPPVVVVPPPVAPPAVPAPAPAPPPPAPAPPVPVPVPVPAPVPTPIPTVAPVPPPVPPPPVSPVPPAPPVTPVDPTPPPTPVVPPPSYPAPGPGTPVAPAPT
ncbi:hypothetical protein HDU88_005267 [Geranomyces variabilis]|nr:hypothetical protein HDU88_005267 [Geranomyces variabilis]